MQKDQSVLWNNVLLAVVVSVIGYIILKSTSRTGLVDMSIEMILWFVGSMIAFRGFIKSNGRTNINFKKFEFFYGLTYLIIAVSFVMGVHHLLKNPTIIEIGVADITKSSWLIIMSSIKSFSMVFLIITWSYFYKFLNIKVSRGKMIAIFSAGFLLYLGAAAIIWWLTNDLTVLSLGIVVGLVIGIFALIAQDTRARYLMIIFTIYSGIHLVEFYLMGTGSSLTTGLNNPIYWGVTVLYILEISSWIKQEMDREEEWSNAKRHIL